MEGTRKNKPKCTKIALPDNMPDNFVSLAKLFQIDETCTQRMRISLNSLIP